MHTDLDTPASHDEATAVNWPLLALLSLTHYVVDIYASFITPLLPGLETRLHLAPMATAAVVVVLNISTSFTQPLCGYVSDRFRPGQLVLWGPLVAVVLMSGIGLTDRYAMLIVLVAGTGVGVAAFHPEGAAIAGRAGGRRRAFAVAIFIVSGHLGLASGPIIAGWIAETWGIHYSWVMLPPGLLLLVGLGIALRRRRSPIVAHRQTSATWSAITGPQRRLLTLLVAVSTLRSFLFTAFLFGMPFWWTALQYGEQRIGALCGLFVFCGGCAGFIGGLLAADGHEKRWIVWPFVLALPVLWLLPAQQTLIHIAVYTALAGVGVNASVPIVLAYAQKVVPGGESVASSLILGLSWGLGGVLAPFIVRGLQGMTDPADALQWAALVTAPAIGCALALPSRPSS